MVASVVYCVVFSLPLGKLRETSSDFYEAYLIPPAPVNHASFLQEMPNGDFLLAWFAGTAEGADNCSIVMSRLPKGSDQWSNARVVSRRPRYSNQNPVLFLDPTGQVIVGHLTHHNSPSPPPSPSLRCCTSSTHSSQLPLPLLPLVQRLKPMCGCCNRLMKVSIGRHLMMSSLRTAHSTGTESSTPSRETGSSPSTMQVLESR